MIYLYPDFIIMEESFSVVFCLRLEGFSEMFAYANFSLSTPLKRGLSG